MDNPNQNEGLRNRYDKPTDNTTSAIPSESSLNNNSSSSSSSSSSGSSSITAPNQAQAAEAGESQIKKFLTRLIVGWILIFVLFGILYLGHFYVLIFVCGLQILMFQELINVRYKEPKERKIPLFRTIQWSCFALAIYYYYGETILEFLLKHDRYSFQILRFGRIHQAISFVIYTLLFAVTTLSFRKKVMRYQFGQIAWTLVTIGLIVVQTKSILYNVFAGLFWFLLPASLIVCNDCMAYFVGRSVGRKFIKRPFLRISPNKTWEGFIGGFFFTLIFAFFWPRFLIHPWLVCPPTELFETNLACIYNPVFLPETLPLDLFGWEFTVTILPIQLHTVALAIFAGALAPFGGFFASGIKRAYGVKDFASLIPGHGGVMDRMDCQFLMALATMVYYQLMIQQPLATVPTIISQIQRLSIEDRIRIVEAVKGMI